MNHAAILKSLLTVPYTDMYGWTYESTDMLHIKTMGAHFDVDCSNYTVAGKEPDTYMKNRISEALVWGLGRKEHAQELGRAIFGRVQPPKFRSGYERPRRYRAELSTVRSFLENEIPVAEEQLAQLGTDTSSWEKRHVLQQARTRCLFYWWAQDQLDTMCETKYVCKKTMLTLCNKIRDDVPKDKRSDVWDWLDARGRQLNKKVHIPGRGHTQPFASWCQQNIQDLKDWDMDMLTVNFYVEAVHAIRNSEHADEAWRMFKM